MSGEILGIILRRIAVAIPLMLLVSVLVFIVLRLIPADPVAMSMPPNATNADVEALRREMGLHLPVMHQYVIWLGHLLEGDLGKSIAFGQPVSVLIGQSLPATIELAVFGRPVRHADRPARRHSPVPAARPAGRTGGRCRQHVDDVDPGVSLGAVPDPGLRVALNLLPFAGRLPPDMTVPRLTGFLLLDSLLTGNVSAFLEAIRHMLLPALALALGTVPLIMRLLRSSLLDVIGEDYVTMARLRGVPERRVVNRHALRNALLPTLSLMGVQFGFLFGGTLLVEVIYSYPGLGNLMVEAVRNTDLPIIQGAALIFALAVLTINLVVDVIYIVVNPKLRRAR